MLLRRSKNKSGPRDEVEWFTNVLATLWQCTLLEMKNNQMTMHIIIDEKQPNDNAHHYRWKTTTRQCTLLENPGYCKMVNTSTTANQIAVSKIDYQYVSIQKHLNTHLLHDTTCCIRLSFWRICNCFDGSMINVEKRLLHACTLNHIHQNTINCIV